VNFDGLVGPTHNYAGLAFGNLASTRNRDAVSNPRAAALQGLEKMKMLMDMGIAQCVIPPQVRPHFPTLRRLGFSGNEQDILEKAWKKTPDVFSACCSASSMWTANAATVAPSADTTTGKLTFTPANLLANFHRGIEADATTRLLRRIFADTEKFQINDPLPGFAGLSDEGAANHMRLGGLHQQKALHIFVYGAESHKPAPVSQRYPARQTLAASRAVARLNQLHEDSVIFVRQNPAAIDAGVFHNDVIAVSHPHFLLCHERAYVNQTQVISTLRSLLADTPLQIVQVKEQDIPLELAIGSYLFNSQIVTTQTQENWLILPVECEENPLIKSYVDALVSEHDQLHGCRFVDVRQSMRNGGGPACLRLRVPMTADQFASLNERALLTPQRYLALREHISATYPDRLQLDDLQDWPFCATLIDSLLKIYDILGLPRSLCS
jgi:succinylarginine dihydrolase